MDTRKISQIAMGIAILSLGFFAFNSFRASSKQAADKAVMDELGTDIARLRTTVAELAEQIEARQSARSQLPAGGTSAQGGGDWCHRIASAQVRLGDTAWILHSADTNESDNAIGDSLVCGAQGLIDAKRYLDLVHESEVSAESPAVIGDIPVFCERVGEASTRVRVYHEMRPHNANPDPAYRETLWGVAVLASRSDPSMDAQRARIDGLVRQISARGCDAVAQELAAQP